MIDITKMTIMLNSDSKEMRDILKSDAFQRNNYEIERNPVTYKYESKLNIKYIPNVGDYLYFINDYYEIIPMKVNRIVRNSSTTLTIIVDKATLHDIDPYIYGDDNRLSAAFVHDVDRACDILKDKLPKKVQEAKDLYCTNEVNEHGILVEMINNFLGIDRNTVLDYQNVLYCIYEALNESHPYTYAWTRPAREDYAQF